MKCALCSCIISEFISLIRQHYLFDLSVLCLVLKNWFISWKSLFTSWKSVFIAFKNDWIDFFHREKNINAFYEAININICVGKLSICRSLLHRLTFKTLSGTLQKGKLLKMLANACNILPDKYFCLPNIKSTQYPDSSLSL